MELLQTTSGNFAYVNGNSACGENSADEESTIPACNGKLTEDSSLSICARRTTVVGRTVSMDGNSQTNLVLVTLKGNMCS